MNESDSNYRLLKEGDVLQAGDEYLNNGRWWPSGGAGMKIGSPGYRFGQGYRRKVEDEDRWIALSERMPDKFPCQVYLVSGKSIVAWEHDGEQFHIPGAWVDQCHVTHWKPLRLSPPPEPQKSKEGLGFKEWMPKANFMHWTNYEECARESWLAALAWKEKNG